MPEGRSADRTTSGHKNLDAASEHHNGLARKMPPDVDASIRNISTSSRPHNLSCAYEAFIRRVVPPEMLNRNGHLAFPEATVLRIIGGKVRHWQFRDVVRGWLGMENNYYTPLAEPQMCQHVLESLRDQLKPIVHEQLRFFFELQQRETHGSDKFDDLLVRTIRILQPDRLDVLAHEAMHDVQLFLLLHRPDSFDALLAESRDLKAEVIKLAKHYPYAFGYDTTDLFDASPGAYSFLLSRGELTVGNPDRLPDSWRTARHKAELVTAHNEIRRSVAVLCEEQEIAACLAGLSYLGCGAAAELLAGVLARAGLRIDYATSQNHQNAPTDEGNWISAAWIDHVERLCAKPTNSFGRRATNALITGIHLSDVRTELCGMGVPSESVDDLLDTLRRRWTHKARGSLGWAAFYLASGGLVAVGARHLIGGDLVLLYCIPGLIIIRGTVLALHAATRLWALSKRPATTRSVC